MILFEDMEFEKSVLDTRYHIAVPVVVTENSDGAVTLLVYSFCKKIAEEFEARFSAAPFSEEAKAFLYEKLTPVMNAMEYGTENACENIHLTYQLTDAADINPACFRGRAVRLDALSEQDKEKSETELYAFEINPTDELDRIFAVRGRRGEVAAFAAINDISENAGFYELNVECAEAYQQQGYGSECVAELARYLLGHGVPVEYLCGEENIASVRTAEKVGFRLVKKTMHFVCYRADDEEDGEEDSISF